MSPRTAIADDPVDRLHLPVDEWRLVETGPGGDLGLLETLFSVANGYLGMRGTPEEGRDAKDHGTFINGFHETWQINHAESAYGFAQVGQTIVNVPDSTVMKLYVDDEPLLLRYADLEEYRRWVDFREGVLRRELVWRTPAGKRIRVRTSRMVSMTNRHLAQMTMELEMIEGSAPIAVSSQIINRQDGGDDLRGGIPSATGDATSDPRRTTSFSQRVLEPQNQWHDDQRILLGWRTASSRMSLAVGADHQVTSDLEIEELVDTYEDQGKHVFRTEMPEGSTLRIEKAVAYHSSAHLPIRELFDRCRRTLDRVRENGFRHDLDEQRDYLTDFWERTDVRIADHPAEQQATRWCLFQLAQATARADGLGVGAKGVTGSGYEGHYFWDTDTYVVPCLTFTNPRWARNALRFRVGLLDVARARARELNQRGALFPWRTINGQEASAYYAAGTAQYHIDADVAFALSEYVDVSGDLDFHDRQGTEVLVETARMWADLGFWRRHGDGSETFQIHGVTGPDEYTTVVNNNMFTNVMARYNLERAASSVRDLQGRNPEEYQRLVAAIGLDEDEIARWEDSARGMKVTKDEALGIHPQDDTFLEKEVWDLANTPDDAWPLLLHFHPLVIYRFQVLKQADVVLALFLRGSEFTLEEKRADFEYYDPITTGDSTLSAVVQSIVAAEVGHRDAALDYFRQGLFADLADLHGNTSDGVHIASAGGVWNALVSGFGGMRQERGRVSFDPRLPESWPSLTFPLTVRGSRFLAHLVQESITFTLVEGDPIEVTVRGRTVLVTEAGVRVDLADQGPRAQDMDLSEPSGVGVRRADGSIITSSVPTDPHAPWEDPVEPPPSFGEATA
jgi:alpha,alpha-trehalose phosphorylase